MRITRIHYKLYLAATVFLVILSPLWIYNNWYALLNQLLPFNDLTNKIALDGIDIADFSERVEIDEIYLVDTVTNAIRQLTNDNYRDEHPNISFEDNRIYFVSNRFIDQDKPYGKERSSIFYYDLTEQAIYPAYPTLTNLLSDSTSDIKDLYIRNDLISFIEYHNGNHKLKIGHLGTNVLIAEDSVNEISVIMDINSNEVILKELGESRTLKIN